MKITLLDRLYSEFIRRRAIARVGGCERCLSPKWDITKEDGSIFPAWKQLQCSHFHGRGKGSVRYDEDNGAGLCGACHMYFTAHPLEHTEWFKAHLGEREFDMLSNRARIVPYKPDKEAISLYYQEKLEKADG